MKYPRQSAILVGGLGTRLGALTAETPKPLLPCGDRPFLAWVLGELMNLGIEEVVLLAGHKAEAVQQFVDELGKWLPVAPCVRISFEPEPAGTGGALWYAHEELEESFLMLNGDSWIDTDLRQFLNSAAGTEDAKGALLLRSMDDCSRYGTVELEGKRITAFREKANTSRPGLISGGIYLLDRQVLSHVSPRCSMEVDVLPALVAENALTGYVMDGYFIDIGIPADYERAQYEIPQRLRIQRRF